MTLRELVKRWKAETPSFFKKIIKIGTGCVTVGSAILTSEHFNLIPEVYTNIAGHLIGIGLAIATIAKLAVKDTKDLL